MKKKAIIKVGLLAVILGEAAFANAQSSLQLSGIINDGISYANNVGHSHILAASSGQLSPSRVIFSGAEDLSSDTQSTFFLSNPFNTNTGGGNGRAFNYADVGLASKAYGNVTLGRQPDVATTFFYPYTSNELWAGGAGSHIGDNDNLNQTFKVSNSLKYVSPVLSGAQFGADYSFSNSSGSGGGFNVNRLWSVGGSYKFDRFGAAAGYIVLDQPGQNTAGAVGSAGSTVASDYSNIFTTSPVGNSGVSKQTIFLLGAGYAFSNIKLGAVYSHVIYDYFNNISTSINNAEVNATYSVTPALQLGLAYQFTKAIEGGSGQRPAWQQINLAVDYFLSKHTTIYDMISAQQATGGAKAQINTFAASSTSRQFVEMAGLLVTF